MKVSFGDYTADFEARELRRGATRVHLSPKALRLLELLVESRPKALSKAELQEALWPDVYVLESNLADLVSELRGALGQTGQRTGFIRTLHGFGYAFSAPTEEGAEAPAKKARPSWRLTWRDGQASLGEGEFVMGRDPDVAVSIDDETVSWRHARLQIAGSGAKARATVTDLESSNGTYLNGQRLTGPAEAHHGDELRLGSARVALRLLSAERQPTRPMRPGE
jgi:DNA-binding winged helix-turn-helix (wHTH) protein